jgi:hypothetical protein
MGHSIYFSAVQSTRFWRIEKMESGGPNDGEDLERSVGISGFRHYEIPIRSRSGISSFGSKVYIARLIIYIFPR